MIIAVVNKKGGVGKTTTTVSLASALAFMGRRVLVIDLDPNAGACLSVGLTPEELSPNAADLLSGMPPGDLIRESCVEGLSVIPAATDMEGFEMAITLGNEQRHQGRHRLYRLQSKDLVLRDRIAPLRDAFDHIFFDTPAAVGLLTRNAMAASDGILIPAVPHFLATSGLQSMVDSAGQLESSTGRAVEILGILLTMVDYRVQATRLAVDELRRRFGRMVFAVEVRTNISLAEAPAHGQPIHRYKPYATGARAYRLLAEELLHRVESRG